MLNITFGGFRAAPTPASASRSPALDHTENDAWFEQATFEDEVAMKSALKQGGSTDLNVYSTSGGGFLGWAYLPEGSRRRTSSTRSTASSSTTARCRAGSSRTSTSATRRPMRSGHYLGLAHTFDAARAASATATTWTTRRSCSSRRRAARRGEGHVPEEAGPRSDPQLHGLLGRHLLHGVHAGSDRAHAEAVRPLALEARVNRAVGRAGDGSPLLLRR